MTTIWQAEHREKTNKSGLRALRGAGRLPAVIFGKGEDNRIIHISALAFQKWLRSAGSGIIQLNVEGSKPITVLLEDIQRHPVTRELLHVDFQQVKADSIVRTKIPIDFVGTPVGTKQGGVVQVQLAHIEVEALPRHLPPAVTIDIASLNVGESVRVQDVPFSPEVTVYSEPGEFLLSVVKP